MKNMKEFSTDEFFLYCNRKECSCIILNSVSWFIKQTMNKGQKNVINQKLIQTNSNSQ